MMFKMKLPNASYFADLLSAINTVVDEGTFNITKDGIGIVAMDSAHISLVDFWLLNSIAEEYECGGDSQMTVNITELLKLLKHTKSDEYIIFSYDESEKRLQLVITDAMNSNQKVFSLNTLETTENKITIPKLTFEAKAKISSSAVKNAIKSCSSLSDYVKVTISPEEVVFGTKGDIGEAQIKFTKHSTAVFEIATNKEVYANFSTNYFEKIVKAGSALTDEMTIELSMNKPIRLGFLIPLGKLEYLIAPRLEV